MHFYKVAVIVLMLFMQACANHGQKNISGIWRHSEKPAWIEITFDDAGKGQALMVRHDDYPKAVGNKLLIDIEPRDSGKAWSARIYSAADDNYIPIKMECESDYSLSLTTESDGKKFLTFIKDSNASI